MPLTAQQQDLAAEYVPLARSQAWAFVQRCNGKMDLGECLSAAMLGLVQALQTWEPYCARNNYDPGRADYLRAYLLKRIRGAILDEARAADHLTRSDRKKVKSVRQAEDDGARTDEERAAATGLSVGEVRRLQADAQVTVSLEDQDELTGGAEYAGTGVTDEGANVEGQAVVSGIMAAFLAAFDSLPAIQRILLALCFHQELALDVAAKAADLEPGEARAELEEAVCQVHAAMLLSVSGEGTGPRRPAVVFRVSCADSCSAAELAAAASGKRCNDCGEVLPLEAFSWRDKALGYRVPYCPPCASARAGRHYRARKAAARAAG